MEFTGVFREESPSLFLSTMCKIAREYYSNIEAKVLQKYKKKDERHFRPTVEQCLRDVFAWCPKTKFMQATRIQELYPSLSQLYEHTYIAILQDFAHNVDEKYRDYNIPIFAEFYVLFLMKLAQNEFVLAGKLTDDPERSCLLIMDILRQAFMDCIQYISLKVPLTTANLEAHTAENQTVAPIVPTAKSQHSTHTTATAKTQKSAKKSSVVSGESHVSGDGLKKGDMNKEGKDVQKDIEKAHKHSKPTPPFPTVYPMFVPVPVQMPTVEKPAVPVEKPQPPAVATSQVVLEPAKPPAPTTAVPATVQ